MKFKNLLSVILSGSILLASCPLVASADNNAIVFDYADYSITYEVTNSYGTTDVIDITLTNTGTEKIEDWMLWFEPSGTIQYVTNASIQTEDGVSYFKNNGYNAEVQPNTSVTFTYATDNATEVPDYYSLCQTRVEKVDGYSVSLSVDQDWGTQFSGTIEIANNTDTPIEFWELTIDTNFTISEITNSWSASVTDFGDDGYLLKGTYTSIIPANSSVQLGFIGVKNGTPMIESYDLTEMVAVVSDPSLSYIDLSSDVFKVSTTGNNVVTFYAECDLEVSAIQLRDANSHVVLADMVDGGDIETTGDEYADDGIYTCQINVDNSVISDKKYYATYSNLKSDDVVIHIYRTFTQQELDDMNAVDYAVSSLMESATFIAMSESDQINAINTLLTSFTVYDNSLGYSLIQENSVAYTSDGKCFSFTYACGVSGIVDLSSSTDTDDNVQEIEEVVTENLILTENEETLGSVLLMHGFENIPFRNYYYTSLANEISSAGWSVDLVTDVTIEDIENMQNHDFIAICMHGVYPRNSHIILCTQETVNENKNNQYSYELQNGWVMPLVTTSGVFYCFTEELIEEFYNDNSFDDSIVYLQNCYSVGAGDDIADINTAMADAFINYGADSVVGNLNSISSDYNQEMMRKFIEELIDGSTTYSALIECKDAYGYDDGDGDGIIEPKLVDENKLEAVACLVGSTTKTMVKSNIENGSFESQLSGWQIFGDASTKLKLGSIRPSNGKRMAFITTKANETDSSGIYQTFKIPEYARTLTFTYDVISEEPMEWIDTGYNDTFVAKLITLDGVTVLASESTDDSEWLRIRDVNLPYGDNTTYHTGTITVTCDVSELRGTSVKLFFSVEDSGDNTYDTAAIIDNVSLTN